MRTSARSYRRTRSVECFKSATDCIGMLEKGMALFAVTRGQFSMIDAIMACIDQMETAEISLWTWTVAEYEVQCLDRLRNEGRISAGTFIIDYGARNKNAGLIRQWKDTFGEESVRYTVNHAKIATVQDGNFRLLLRGSMNLNFNPRFEQFDLTEGGDDFELVKDIEADLPILADDASGAEIFKASRLEVAFDREQLELFKGIRVWAK